MNRSYAGSSASSELMTSRRMPAATWAYGAVVSIRLCPSRTSIPRISTPRLQQMDGETVAQHVDGAFAACLRSAAVVDQMIGPLTAQPHNGKRRPGAVAQRALKSASRRLTTAVAGDRLAQARCRLFVWTASRRSSCTPASSAMESRTTVRQRWLVAHAQITHDSLLKPE
jgi:hypothetical protein